MPDRGVRGVLWIGTSDGHIIECDARSFCIENVAVSDMFSIHRSCRFIMDEAILCDFLQRDLLPVSELLVPGRGIAVTSIAQSGMMPVLVVLTQSHAHLLSLWTGKPLHRSKLTQILHRHSVQCSVDI